MEIVGGTKVQKKYNAHPRILIRRTGDSLCSAYLKEPALTESTLYSCWSTDDDFPNLYLFGLLNSTLYTYIINASKLTNEQAFPQILLTDLKELPVKKAPAKIEKNIIDVATHILTAKEEDPEADTTGLEEKIDQLVYELYGLSEEEIGIVEETLK